ncbi:MAG: DUF72 domain-containing protein [Candidatus Dormibacteraeota bacterium]|nr:DUF72 domain-containing protein [Candidatus Dormibacteraeota bacterium]
MLAYYAERLNGVELNGTFYQLPPVTTLAGWAGQVHQAFRFCCKASRGLTYSAAAFDKAGMAATLGERLGALGDRLGPTLVQWPPGRQRDEQLLERLLTAFARPAAVEFRHESWFCAPVYDCLRRHGAALCRTDAEEWPLAPMTETGQFAYVRLRRSYERPALERWRRELRALAAGGSVVHVYFKHDPEGPERARFMLE